MLQHILFASERSHLATPAFDHLLKMAAEFKSQVTLFHAYPLLSTSFPEAYDLSISASIAELELTMEERAKRHLGEYKVRLDELEIPNQMLILRGSPGLMICQVARQRQCDLIIMGRNQNHQLGSFLMGSTSSYVLHHSPCPVMIVPLNSENPN